MSWVSMEQLRRINQVAGAEIIDAMTRREHMWIAGLSFRIQVPPNGPMIFDGENLLAGPIIVCVICDQLWSPTLGELCPGEPVSEGNQQ